MRRSNTIEAVLVGVAVLCVITVIVWAASSPTRHVAPVVRPPAPLDPLVYKTKGNLRLVRAVFQGHLYVLLFEHRGGVWFFEGARLASEIKS